MAKSQYTISGTVTGSRNNAPVPYSVITVHNHAIWASSDEDGRFRLKNVPPGKNTIIIRQLGYITGSRELVVTGDVSNLAFVLEEDNLTLDEVLVTAKQDADNLSTSFVMDRTVLDHMQMLNVTDVTSLLPGGKTNRDLHLATGSQAFSVIGTGSPEMGNAVFGVGVELDGVRLSGNAIPGSDASGTDTRNIASSNIERIEIISGIPSVEYGDMTNGFVKIHTRKGATPFILDMVTNPNTKQVALSKGVSLGPRAGVLNVSLEHTRSIADLASPYTSYTRNGLSLNYLNTFGKKGGKPLEIDAGLKGNLGGYNSESDPDLFVNTYSKTKDNVLRGNFSARWLLDKSWITNLELSGAVNYNNNLSEVQTNKSASASFAALHTMQEGYVVGQTYDVNPNAEIILIQPGYWYEKRRTDSRLLNYALRLKGNWSSRLQNIDQKILAGAEYTASGNLGRGTYYEDMRYAPEWREYRYDAVPFSHNYAFYIEDKARIPVAEQSFLDIAAGLRAEITSVKNSVYNNTRNLSPRLNIQYTFWEKSKRDLEELSVKAGWGRTVKLPSFGMLFPTISYRDYLTFAPGTTSDGSTYYAYYTMPSTPVYNPELKWQSNIKYELAVNLKYKGTRVFISASQDVTYHPYKYISQYTPFTYKFTDQSNLESSQISIADRVYTVDRQTGVVTVTDKTGSMPSETLQYKEYTRFIGNSMPVNGSAPVRKRLQWIIDFARIRSIRTQFRVDGNLYSYRGVEETITPYMINTTINMADGSPYAYIGFFRGSSSWSNGAESRSVNLNLTSTTHIPAIRLIFSFKIEATLHSYSRNLSESAAGSRGFVLDGRDSYTPSETRKDIYAGNQFIGVYPEYYISLDDPDTPVPFAEKFLWAKDNDPALYNELAKMVAKTYYDSSFNASRISPYFSMNAGVTKEIGRKISVTFNAKNFFSNMGTYRVSTTNSTGTLFNSSYIPAFYYGLSLRVKW